MIRKASKAGQYNNVMALLMLYPGLASSRCLVEQFVALIVFGANGGWRLGHAGCIAKTIQAKTLFEIVAVAVLPVMVLAYYVIQRLVVHHTRAETVLMLEELVVEAMNKHDHDIEGE